MTKVEKKKWYRSKTIWANAIGIGALIVQYEYGFFVEPTLQLAALSFVNLILRMITTKGLFED